MLYNADIESLVACQVRNGLRRNIMKAIKITSFLSFAVGADKVRAPSELANQITSALHDVNGKATSHTYTTGKEILDELAAIDTRMEKMLGGKKYLPGAVVFLESGDSVPNAYKYTRIGSIVKCVRRSSAWYVTEINCCDLYKNGGKNRISLTADQDLRACAVLRTNYHVIAK